MELSKAEKELEKLIKKLESLDIREWNYHRFSDLITEKYGLKFTLHSEWMRVESVTGNMCYVSYSSDNIKNKPLKKMLKQFHDQTYNRLLEYQQKELEEKLKEYLSD